MRRVMAAAETVLADMPRMGEQEAQAARVCIEAAMQIIQLATLVIEQRMATTKTVSELN
jgi:hypothetical protein